MNSKVTDYNLNRYLIVETVSHDIMLHLSDRLPDKCCHKLQSSDSRQAECQVLADPRAPLLLLHGADGALRPRQPRQEGRHEAEDGQCDGCAGRIPSGDNKKISEKAGNGASET